MLCVHPVAVPAVRLLFRLLEHVRTKPLTTFYDGGLSTPVDKQVVVAAGCLLL
jgi:hypothetical protein